MRSWHGAGIRAAWAERFNRFVDKHFDRLDAFVRWTDRHARKFRVTVRVFGGLFVLYLLLLGVIATWAEDTWNKAVRVQDASSAELVGPMAFMCAMVVMHNLMGTRERRDARRALHDAELREFDARAAEQEARKRETEARTSEEQMRRLAEDIFENIERRGEEEKRLLREELERIKAEQVEWKHQITGEIYRQVIDQVNRGVFPSPRTVRTLGGTPLQLHLVDSWKEDNGRAG